MTDTVEFTKISVGTELPALVRTPTTEQLVRYAGAASDPARIHYDEAEARARGFDGVIVHGLLKAAFLAELVTSWCGERAWVKRFATQYRGTDRPGQPLICRGKVTATDYQRGEPTADVDVWIENSQGRITTRGTATVVFAEPKHKTQAASERSKRE